LTNEVYLGLGSQHAIIIPVLGFIIDMIIHLTKVNLNLTVALVFQ
jgi:hypothetical protein